MARNGTQLRDRWPKERVVVWNQRVKRVVVESCVKMESHENRRSSGVRCGLIGVPVVKDKGCERDS